MKFAITIKNLDNLLTLNYYQYHNKIRYFDTAKQ